MEIRCLDQRSFDATNYGASMSKAFLNEPNFAYIIPDLSRRRKGLSWFFGTFVSQLGFRLGQVYGEDNYGGQAVWIKPDCQVGFRSAMQAGFFSMPFHFGIMGLTRFMTLGKYVEEVRRESSPERAWYLMALGVSPERQRQHIGSALMQPLFLQADQEQMPCYLETFAERNLAFYTKHGFAVTRKSQVKDGPVFWGMVRLPK